MSATLYRGIRARAMVEPNAPKKVLKGHLSERNWKGVSNALWHADDWADSLPLLLLLSRRKTDRQTAEEEKEGKNRRGSEVKLGEGGSITIPQKPLSLAPAPGLPSNSTRFLSLPSWKSQWTKAYQHICIVAMSSFTMNWQAREPFPGLGQIKDWICVCGNRFG